MSKLDIFLIAICVCLVLLPARIDPAIWLKKRMDKREDIYFNPNANHSDDDGAFDHGDEPPL